MLVERARELIAAGRPRGGGPRAASGATRSSPSTRRSRRATSASTSASCGCLAAPLVEGTRPRPGAHPRARSRERRRPRPVRHDRLLAAPDERGANAVSQLHADTANGTWQRHRRAPDPGHHQRRPRSDLGRPADGRRSTRSSARDLDDLDDETPRARFWERLDAIPDAKLWEAPPATEAASWPSSPAAGSCASSRATARRRTRSPQLDESLDPDILTIGFARRFATYKRAALLFSDEERLARLLWDAERPVQIVFAGKAHPADRPGQRVIQDIFERSRRRRASRGRVFILEDYDMRDRAATSCRASTSG